MTRLLRHFCVLLALAVMANSALAAEKARYQKHVVKLPSGEREFYIYIPKSLKKGAKAPAVITFHGFKSDANGMRWLIKSDAIAEKYGYIMVYPNAVNKSWNVGRGSGTVKSKVDDLSFASALVDVIKARFPVDKNRIYAMGFSNGAQMVALMACRVPHKLAAGAMVAHTMNLSKCAPGHKLPMALIHGAKDKFAPLAGGGKHALGSHADSVSFFRQIHGLKGEGKVVFEKPTVRCRSWGDGKKPSLVQGCVALDGGHNWPGGVEFQVETFGKVNTDLNATKYIFDFFGLHEGKPVARDKNQKVAMKFPDSGKKKKPAKAAGKKPKTKTATGNPNKKPAGKQKTAKSKAVAKPAGPKLEWREQVDGKNKYKYAVYRPMVFPAGESVRLVAVLGPKATGPDRLAQLFDIAQYGSAFRTVFVFFPFDPWQKPARDAARVAQALGKVNAEFSLDTNDWHVIAWSDGGRIAEEIVCTDAPSFTSMVFIGYGWRRKACEQPLAIPAMLVHSKADKRHPWKGKKDKGVLPVTRVIERYKSWLGGGLLAKELKKAKDHRCTSYRDHSEATELAVCSVDWGGNTVPGSKVKVPDEFGKVMGSFNVLPFVYQFIARHRYHGFTAVRQR